MKRMKKVTVIPARLESQMTRELISKLRMSESMSIPGIKAIGGVRVKIFILSYFKELHKGDQRLFTECQN